MREILAENKLISSILFKQTIDSDTAYVQSIYTYTREIKGVAYLLNTLTRQCYELGDSERESWLSMGNSPISGLDVLGNDFLSELAASHFLVPLQRDEAAVYEELINISSNFDRRNGFTSYTILPTTACNARCFYCYEEDFQPSNMSAETLEQLVKYILETKDSGKITFNWFGGEPLLGIKTIDAVCEEMRAHDVKFQSSIVTNGILMDGCVLPRAIDDWNLTFAQFSLDGDEDEYNRRKNYKTSYPSAYRKVLENIKALSLLDIDITLRCNVDYDNSATLDSFLDDISGIVTPTDRISIVFLPLYALQTSENGCNDLWERCREMRLKAQSRGFRLQKSVDLGTLSVRACMAQDVDGSVTITPSGSLYTCEHCIPGTSIGDIWNGVTNDDVFNAYKRRVPATEDCRQCKYLPFCTTFNLCPIKRTNCNWVMNQWLNEALDMAIVRT